VFRIMSHVLLHQQKTDSAGQNTSPSPLLHFFDEARNSSASLFAWLIGALVCVNNSCNSKMMMKKRGRSGMMWCCCLLVAAVVATTKVVDAFAPPSATNKVAAAISAPSSHFRWTGTAAGFDTNKSFQQRPQLSMAMAAMVDVAAAENSILHNPTTWSILAMTSIVGLLVAWEETIHNLRHNTPKPILPVIDSMLAEVGGLG